MMQRWIAAGMTAMLSGACLVAATVAVRAEQPPAGIWTVTAAERLTRTGIEPIAAEDGLYLNKRIEFRDAAVTGPGPLACANARYAYAPLPAQALFQGYPADAADAGRIAAIVELPDPVRTLMLTCDTGVFDFHMADENTMKTMLDLVIYTLKRR